MHVTLHLTTECNQACTYCYSSPVQGFKMSVSTIEAALDFAGGQDPNNPGIVFFGGEPLLEKELIKAGIKYGDSLRQSRGFNFHYKTTTNGILLDREFVDYSTQAGLEVSVSLDGVKASHEKHRLSKTGESSYDLILHNLRYLLTQQPYAHVYMTITPQNVSYYAESVEFIYSLGVIYLVTSLDMAGNWDDTSLRELRKQYEKLSKIYEQLTENQTRFYFSPFETRIASLIRAEEHAMHCCMFSKRQVSISHTGEIYPCIQFVQDGVRNKEYVIGDVWKGLDKEKQEFYYQQSLFEDPDCEECALKSRCRNDCCCLNWQTTGHLTQISPVLCESERIVFPIVDKLASRLYKKRLPMFVQKHYNRFYPYFSMLADIPAR